MQINITIKFQHPQINFNTLQNKRSGNKLSLICQWNSIVMFQPFNLFIKELNEIQSIAIWFMNYDRDQWNICSVEDNISVYKENKVYYKVSRLTTNKFVSSFVKSLI